MGCWGRCNSQSTEHPFTRNFDCHTPGRHCSTDRLPPGNVACLSDHYWNLSFFIFKLSKMKYICLNHTVNLFWWSETDWTIDRMSAHRFLIWSVDVLIKRSIIFGCTHPTTNSTWFADCDWHWLLNGNKTDRNSHLALRLCCFNHHNE